VQGRQEILPRNSIAAAVVQVGRLGNHAKPNIDGSVEFLTSAEEKTGAVERVQFQQRLMPVKASKEKSFGLAGFRVKSGFASGAFSTFLQFIGKNFRFLTTLRTFHFHCIQGLVAFKSRTMLIGHSLSPFP
jgi:hypothetical protein